MNNKNYYPLFHPFSILAQASLIIFSSGIFLCSRGPASAGSKALPSLRCRRSQSDPHSRYRSAFPAGASLTSFPIYHYATLRTEHATRTNGSTPEEYHTGQQYSRRSAAPSKARCRRSPARAMTRTAYGASPARTTTVYRLFQEHEF